jgi:hypothetical protein
VQLVRGDVSVAATGTVTYVDGNRVVAFGHPMFNVGEVYLPIATSQVHTFMAAQSSSFKIASPIDEVGSLIQDRQSGISGDLGIRAATVPVNISVEVHGQPTQAFHAEVVRHRFLTPLLAATVISNSAQAAVSDVSDAVVTLKSKLNVRGFAPLELVDHVFSSDGVSPRALGGSTGIKAIGEILFNPFAPADLERVDITLQVEYRAAVAEIVGIALNSDELEAGSRPNLNVTLRPYDGAEFTETIPIQVPRELVGQPVKIIASAGALAKPDLAPPESLGGLVDNLRKSYSARSIVVSFETFDEGVALRGRIVPDLPDSVIDTLRPGASTRRTETFRRALRVVAPMSMVVQGRQELAVRVRSDRMPE